MFSSIIRHLFKSTSHNDTIQPNNVQKSSQSISMLEDAIVEINGTLLHDFSLFYHENTLLIDLLIFLPHYGLYLGERISWKAQDLEGTSVERSSKQNKRSSTTRLESSERIIHQKLEDVLSFDSTPIERFFLMEHLCESEFDALHPSFHTLLSKKRLIFSDDDSANIQKKLLSLCARQNDPYSKLKTVGSLQAHTLMLPTKEEPFGNFLSDEQQTFLYAPLIASSITILNGNCAAGKSSVLIRKVLHALLQNTETKAVFVTPTRLSGEILRKECIAMCDFAAVTLDYTRLAFLNPPTPHDKLHLQDLPHDASIIVYDDLDLLDKNFIDQLHEELQLQSIFISSSHCVENEISYPLKSIYRSPSVKNIQFTHTQKSTLFLLDELKKVLNFETPILIVLPSDDLLLKYKNIIDEHFQIECQLLTSAFSLQYKNLDPVTLSTPNCLSGVCVPHCYVINIPYDTPEYYVALSRATHTVTVISEEIVDTSISH